MRETRGAIRHGRLNTGLRGALSYFLNFPGSSDRAFWGLSLEAAVNGSTGSSEQ